MVSVGEEVRRLLRLAGLYRSLRPSPHRAYKLEKIQENNTAEIMEVVLEDARESYAEEIVVELRSESPDDVEENVARIVAWVEAWRKDHP